MAMIFFLSAGSLYAQQQVAESSGEYILGAGDVLDVMVYGEPEISRTVFVRIDGRISLPLAGEVKASGSSPAGLAERITEKLERFLEEPEVAVILAESRSKVYYILGQVASPGEYPITRKVTVIQAIARAGGFREWAKKDRIMIVSGPEDEKEEKISYFNYDKFLKQDAEGRNTVIQPGDTIVIP
ncbi:MAG: polysaccharide export protein [Desulfobacteraceae bacterium]|nr:polysaccharide export protein [Desulfobacteraceae bacterium]